MACASMQLSKPQPYNCINHLSGFRFAATKNETMARMLILLQRCKYSCKEGKVSLC